MIKTAVVLVGGKGARLRPLTDRTPKPLVEIAGKPMLYWKIRWLKSYGIQRLVLGLAYKKEKIVEFVEKNNNFGLDIAFSEDSGNGTGEAINLAVNGFVKDDDFLVANGDDVTTLNINKMASQHDKKKPLATLAISNLNLTASTVETNLNGIITKFVYCRQPIRIQMCNGIYIFNKRIIGCLGQSEIFEEKVFTELAEKKALASYVLSDGEYWHGINNAQELLEAKKEKAMWMKFFE